MKFRALMLLALLICCTTAYTQPPNVQNWVQTSGSIRMNVFNNGIFGNSSPFQGEAVDDPCPPYGWAPQCEYPAGSDQQYLYMSALWIGALIVEGQYEIPRVSVGIDGWFNPSIAEFWPGNGEENSLTIRSNIPEAQDCFGNDIYDPEARANEEVTSVFCDTLTDPDYVIGDPVDGVHRPLGLEITRSTMTWNHLDTSDFVIIEYFIRNIGDNYLKNIYLGLYVDADIGDRYVNNRHADDITGFFCTDPQSGDTLNIAYIADNDGRPPGTPSGPPSCPAVAGTRVLHEPGDLQSSYNWWMSNRSEPYDFGPAWQEHCEGGPLQWTSEFGTPVGDERKYQLLSNGEFDFDQVLTEDAAQGLVPPQHYINPFTGEESDKPWCTEDLDDPFPTEDIANGYDTRYLMSWGPLGVFDYIEGNGNHIYRLNPGEQFNLTIAYVLGPDFHDANNPQPDPGHLNPSLFDLTGLAENARTAETVFEQYLHGEGGSAAPPVPDAFTLYQNYPNPFNPKTVIPFSLPESELITLRIFDITGRLVTTLADERFPAGTHTMRFNGNAYPSGVYFAQLQTQKDARTIKMMLLK